MFNKLLKLSRKYLKKVTSVFLAFYLIFSPLFSFPFDVFAATNIVVTASNMQGWIPTVNDGAVIEFVDAPDSPKPGGALHFVTPNNYDARSRLTKTVDFLLSDISEIKFDAKKLAGPSYANVAFRLGLDNDGDGTLDQWITYEPYYNGTVSGSWQTWDVLNGKFWGAWNPAGGFDTNELIGDVPGVGPDTRVLGISIGLGNWNPEFDILVDNVIFDDFVYDFQSYVINASDSNYSYLVRYIRQNDFGAGADNNNVAAQIRTPMIATDVRFSVYNSASVLLGVFDTNGDSSNTQDDNNVFKAGTQSGLQLWRFKKSLPAGQYTTYAEFEIDGNWYPVTGGPATIYSLSNPTLQIINPNDSKHVFRSSDKFIVRLKISDTFESFDRATFEIDSVTYNITRDLCNLSQAGNYVLCDVGNAVEWDSTIAEGTYVAKVQAWNKANGRASVSPVTTRDFTIDKTAPVVTNFVAPAIASSNTVLSADATDFVGIDFVKFYIAERDINDQCKNNLPSIRDAFGVKDPLSDTYSVNIDTSDLNGNYCVLVSARDLAAHNSTPLFKEIVFDNTAPTVPKWLHSPMITSNGDALYTDPLRISEMRFTESLDMIGAIPNPGGVDYYEYSFVRRDLNGNFLSASASVNMNTYMGGIVCSSGECVWKPDIQPNNQWIYRVRAVDTLGNKSAWSNWNDASDGEFTSFTFSYQDMVNGTGIFARSDFDTDLGNTSYTLRESVKPESSIVSTDSITNNPSVSIEWEAQDLDSELKKTELWYSYNGSAYALFTEAVTNTTSGTFNFSLPDGDGDYCFYTISEDVADDGLLDAGVGNREDVPVDPCELEITLDTQAPTVGTVGVLLDFLAAYVNGNTGFVLGATVSDVGVGIDSSTCELTTDGSTWIPGSILLGYCYTTIPSLPDAQELFLNVRISDLAGNGPVYGAEIERTSDAQLPTTTVDIAQDFYGPATLASLVFNGTADDSVSGISDVKINIRRSSNNQYWTGAGNFWLGTDFFKQSTSFTPTTVAGSTNWSYSGGFPTFVNGLTYTVYAHAKDNVHLLQWGGGTTDSFTWDSEAPINPTVTYPAYTNDDPVTVNWSGASDALSGVDGFYYSFSASPETPAQNPLYWLEETETSVSESLAQGEWYFNIITVDNVGNVSTVSSFGPIVVDQTDPVVDITSHTDGDLVNGSVTVSGSVFDDYLEEYTFVINDGLSDIEGGTVPDFGPLVTPSIIWDTTLVADGLYTISISAKDLAGNVSGVVSVSVVVDNTPGVSTMAQPTDSFITSSEIEIMGQATDLNGIDFVELFYSDAGADVWTLITTIDNPSDDSPFDWTYNWTPVADGVYDIKASSTDILGNVENSAYALNVKYDTTAPVITLLGDNPVTLTEGDAYVDADAQATDNLDGDLTASIVVVNPVNTNVPGTYTVTYNVTDEAGNSALQVTRTVNVNEAPEEAVLGAQNNQFQAQNLQGDGDGDDESGEVLGLVCDVRQNMTGYVYIDRNGNGVRDEGDEGLEGVRVRIVLLDNGEEVVVATLRTDSNGRWKTEVCPGEYEVRIDSETLPNGVELEGEDVLGVTVSDDSGEHNINFTLTEGNTQSGFDFRWILLAIVVGGLLLLAWRKYVASKEASVGY